MILISIVLNLMFILIILKYVFGGANANGEYKQIPDNIYVLIHIIHHM